MDINLEYNNIIMELSILSTHIVIMILIIKFAWLFLVFAIQQKAIAIHVWVNPGFENLWAKLLFVRVLNL